MRKLFVLQSNKNPDYKQELVKCFSICSSNNPHTSINIEELTIKYLIDKSIQVIISNGLPLEWYLIIRGLKIVSIVFDDLELNNELADIVIDHKSNDKNKYFTGYKYSLLQNSSKKNEIQEIFNIVTKLDWDSSYFNFNIAFLSCHHLTENIIHHLNQFIKKENITLIEYLCNCHDNRSVALAEKNRFHFTDIRLTYEKKITQKTPVQFNGNYTFSLAKKEHIPALKEISGSLYKDSRYYFDDCFPNDKIDEFYRNWVEKAVLGTFDHECHSIFKGNRPIGFCTIRYNSETKAQIGLFGISRDYQGQGLSLSLLNSVLNVLFEKSISQIKVVTQGRNYPAQRIYQKAGFFTKITELWYHKWI